MDAILKLHEGWPTVSAIGAAILLIVIVFLYVSVRLPQFSSLVTSQVGYRIKYKIAYLHLKLSMCRLPTVS